MRTNNLAKMFCILLAFCGAMAVASPAQTFTSLYSFCTLSNCDDGKRPTAGLVQGADGNFYGTASGGGTGGVGTAFNISASGTLTPLHSFDISDGLNPYAPLVLANDGNFYGTTATGGSLTLGNVFKMTPSGMVSQVYSFCFQGQGCPEGSIPLAGLVQGTDGNLYGVTQDGGNDSCSGSGGPGCGVVFMLTTGGTLTVLHAFAGMDGASPYSGLTQGADGNFYGTTQFGGTGNNNSCIENSGIGCGTVFKITPSGTLTTLYEFCSQPNCTDGYGPQSGLVQAADGNFYGTTHWGGTATIGNGTIFRITPSGALTTLHKFVGYPNDGANPIGGLIQATDGNFYGTTPSAGAHFLGGTIFRMTPSGGLATLYSFCALSHCDDGSAPYGTLLQATDGNLYGTTSMGGVGCNGGFCGTVFKLSVGLGPFLRVQPGIGRSGNAGHHFWDEFDRRDERYLQRHAGDDHLEYWYRDHHHRTCGCNHGDRAGYDSRRHLEQQHRVPGDRAAAAVSRDSLPSGRYAQDRRLDSRRHVAQLHNHPTRRVRHSPERGCLLA